MDDPGIARPGDKITVLHGSRQGVRGIVENADSKSVIVRFTDGTQTIPLSAILNYSGAARKAWQTRPARAVGRPRDPDLPRKKMVSLRLDAELWQRLGIAVQAGLIRSRESAINEWLQEKLTDLGELPGHQGG